MDCPQCDVPSSGYWHFRLHLSETVASIEHLIAMKSCTGRSKDQIDIEELRKIQEKINP